MSSLGKYIKDEVLPSLVVPVIAIGLIIGLIAFNNLGGFDFIQSLPLYRLDKTDAGWFCTCTFIYFIPFCSIILIALAPVLVVLGLIIRAWSYLSSDD